MEVTSTKERPAAFPIASPAVSPTDAPARDGQPSSAQEMKARDAKLQEDFLAAELRRLDRELAASTHLLQGPPGGIERRAAPRPAVIRLPTTPIKLNLPQHPKRSGLLALVRRLWRGEDVAMRRPY